MIIEVLAEILGDKGYKVDWTTHSLEGYKMSLRQHYSSLLDEIALSDAEMEISFVMMALRLACSMLSVYRELEGMPLSWKA